MDNAFPVLFPGQRCKFKNMTMNHHLFSLSIPMIDLDGRFVGKTHPIPKTGNQIPSGWLVSCLHSMIIYTISMHNQQPLKLLFVINPVSGGKEKQDWEASIREYFKEIPHMAEFYLLNGQSDKRSLQHYIETLSPDRVVAVGGDGTVKMVTELLKDTSIPLGIIPAGSANGMAKELAIPP